MLKNLAISNVLIAATALLLASCGGGGYSTVSYAPSPTPGGPSTSLALTGLVGTAGTLGLAQLNALPQTSVTTSAQAGTGSTGVHTYTGVLLYNVLEAAVPYANANIKNDLLRRAAVITGTDGYQTGIAWGEFDPKFAGKQIIVATQEDGAPLPVSDGFARLIVPGDVFAGRWISNVQSIQLEDSIPQPAQGTLSPTLSFALTGLVNVQSVYTAANLVTLPQSQITVASGGASHTYGGVLLSDLLSSGGLKLNTAKKNDQLTKSLIAVGSDGYTSIETGGEIDPKFGNVKVLVATTEDGAVLPPSTGFARIVVPGDAAAGRYVSSLAQIEVGQL